MTDKEIWSKGMDCLFDNLGFIDAQKFIVMVNSRKTDYTEWKDENLFKDMSEEEFIKNAVEYAKTHDLE
ncbi:MAG: hypothetical protein IJ728_03645 [Selenomonadaceae bacterium]|nr:hypothetical protein [Selenomonadaceae bacterium]